MRGATPAFYHIDLRHDENFGVPCEQFATSLGGFKVDAHGDGDEHVPYSASGFQSFYLRVHSEGLSTSISYFTTLLKIVGNPKKRTSRPEGTGGWASGPAPARLGQIVWRCCPAPREAVDRAGTSEGDLQTGDRARQPSRRRDDRARRAARASGSG